MKRIFALILAVGLLGVSLGSVPLVEGPRAPKGDDSSFVNGRSHDGEELACDFPVSEFMTNIGSKVDGAGMCVDTSIEMAARWAGMENFRGYRDYWAAKEPGGNYPGGVDRQIKAWCQAKKISPVPEYVQYQGDNPEDLLDLADKTGRMACIAYGYSPRYGSCINHMVCVPKFSGQFGVVMDNNLIGGNTRDQLFEWMPKAELVRRMKLASNGRGCTKTSAWVFVWMTPGPPPAPHN